MNNEEYYKFFVAFYPHFKDFKVTVLDLVEDAAANKVTVWARSSASTPVGPYINEVGSASLSPPSFPLNKWVEYGEQGRDQKIENEDGNLNTSLSYINFHI